MSHAAPFGPSLAPRSADRAPGPSVAEAVRAYWDVRAGDFDRGDSRVTRSPEILRSWREVFLDVLGREPLELLDVGCGTGELPLLFHGLGHRVSGVDISPEMVRTGAAKARERGARIDLRVGFAERLPFPDASFDVVHARHLLWTLPDPHATVREWIRVLRPGGRVLVTESAWSGSYDGPLHRVRRAVARLAARVSGAGEPRLPQSPPRYPSPESFPFYGGLTGNEVADFLRGAGLTEVLTLDLAWLRAQGRATLPWPQRWLMKPHRSYYLTWGRSP